MALPNPITGRAMRLPGRISDAQYFMMCVQESVEIMQRNCPDALIGIDVGVDDVPVTALGLADDSMDSVPLAAAMSGNDDGPAKVIAFRRPLERRATDREDLKELTHETLVEQVSALTNRPMHELDPDI